VEIDGTKLRFPDHGSSFEEDVVRELTLARLAGNGLWTVHATSGCKRALCFVLLSDDYYLSPTPTERLLYADLRGAQLGRKRA
jgi:hypothetical protein